jgi:hypothetical protein
MYRRNFFVGAAFFLTVRASVAAPTGHELSRIEKLIQFVETRKNMKFVRNGTEYSCADAAKFLRGKLDSMGQDVTTAREFIERIASKSSMSGEAYHVKFSDGRSMLASQFLSDELKRLESRPA